jgi:hypothetical protein
MTHTYDCTDAWIPPELSMNIAVDTSVIMAVAGNENLRQSAHCLCQDLDIVRISDPVIDVWALWDDRCLLLQFRVKSDRRG